MKAPAFLRGFLMCAFLQRANKLESQSCFCILVLQKLHFVYNYAKKSIYNQYIISKTYKLDKEDRT